MNIDQDANVLYSEEVSRTENGLSITKRLVVTQEVVGGNDNTMVTRTEVTVERRGSHTTEISMNKLRCFATDLLGREYKATDADQVRDVMAEDACELKRRIEAALK